MIEEKTRPLADPKKSWVSVAGKYVTKIVKVFVCYVRYSQQIHQICHDKMEICTIPLVAVKDLIPKRVDCFILDGARLQIDNEDIPVMKR